MRYRRGELRNIAGVRGGKNRQNKRDASISVLVAAENLRKVLSSSGELAAEDG
jgi:hypothetical protein